MTALKSSPQGPRSVISRRPALVATAGLVAVLLTPFVFFPEIIGDAGVRQASPWRNGAALAFLVLGLLAMLAGLVALGGQLRRRPRAKKTGSR